MIHCAHFAWRLTSRSGKWYADGRSNTPSAGRHSLGTDNKSEALKLLPELDRVRAEDLGLIPRSITINSQGIPLPLLDGRRLYETHSSRPQVTGGIRESTQGRYRSIFDKFLLFASDQGVAAWNTVTADLLTQYASNLERRGYAQKTIADELTTVKQAVKWLIQAGHLQGMKPIVLKVQKAECERAYCYRPAEVAAMVQHCQSGDGPAWLGNVIVALACTGLRIAELVSLRWADIDFETERITLTDETGRSAVPDRKRRQLKSGRSRSFPIHDDLMEVLKRIPRVDGYIFHGPRGGRLKADTVRLVLIREVLTPLAEKFPTPKGEKGFIHGRLHSFRHYFCSTCANDPVPERMVMDWLGHADSEMIRHYYHIHDEEAKRRMNQLDFLGGAGGRSGSQNEDKLKAEDDEPTSPETSDNP